PTSITPLRTTGRGSPDPSAADDGRGPAPDLLATARLLLAEPHGARGPRLRCVRRPVPAARLPRPPCELVLEEVSYERPIDAARQRGDGRGSDVLLRSEPRTIPTRPRQGPARAYEPQDQARHRRRRA